MSDLDHRLAALDPAANETYQHPDLDAMIARIVATPANASARWQRIQARFAGGLIAATLVTAVSLVLVQGGPSLPVLAVQRALSAPSASFATAAPMQTNRDVHFRAGSGLSASAPHTDSYELKVPSNPKTETAALAAVFGVVGNATSRGANNWIDANSVGCGAQLRQHRRAPVVLLLHLPQRCSRDGVRPSPGPRAEPHHRRARRPP